MVVLVFDVVLVVVVKEGVEICVVDEDVFGVNSLDILCFFVGWVV